MSKWILRDYGRFVEVTCGDKVILPSMRKDDAYDDFKRIVACVNACEGFTTDGLEQCVSDGDTILNRLEGWQQDCMKAEQQRDELLVALKGIRDMIGYEWLREEFNEARDAIEKAEK